MNNMDRSRSTGHLTEGQLSASPCQHSRHAGLKDHKRAAKAAGAIFDGARWTLKRPAPIKLPNVDALPRRRRIFARGQAREPLRAIASGDRTLLNLFGPIGYDGVTADAFRSELNLVTGDLTVQIHSPGGDVFDGVAMFNLLAAYPFDVRVEVPALAASAASIVCMAADTLAISPTAHFMLHSSWSLCQGPACDMRKEAEILESIDHALVAIYRERTDLSAKELESMLIAETWLRGNEAVQKGFADELLSASPAKAQAHFDLSIYQNTPAALKVAAATPTRVNTIIESRADFEKQLRDKVGLAHAAARKVATAGYAALAGNDDEQTQIDILTESVAKATVAIRK